MDDESLRARRSEPAALRHCHFLFCTVQIGREVVVRVFSSHAPLGATVASVPFVVASRLMDRQLKKYFILLWSVQILILK